jgi:hypothetical protein
MPAERKPRPWFPHLQPSIASLLKTGFFVISFIIVAAYFELFDKIFDSRSSLPKKPLFFSGILVMIGTTIYIVNWVRFILRLPVSRKVTSERWYTVSPITVIAILSAHFGGFVLYLVALARCYGPSLGILISLLSLFTLLRILSHVPI